MFLDSSPFSQPSPLPCSVRSGGRAVGRGRGRGGRGVARRRGRGHVRRLCGRRRPRVCQQLGDGRPEGGALGGTARWVAVYVTGVGGCRWVWVEMGEDG